MQCGLGQINVDNVTMKDAVAAIVRMAQKSDRPRVVCTANLDHLATVHKDLDFRAVYQSADFVVADGMPLVWLSRLTKSPLKERVAGSDLLWELGRASNSTGIRLFFLGGQPGAAHLAAAKVREKHPNAHVVGTYCPAYGTIDQPGELERIHALVGAAAPDILLVGFGSPKQEKWITCHKQTLGVPVLIGVGASFDMAAGLVQRAPIWMRNSGMEWLYRFVQEPARLWNRYFGRDLPFLIRLVALMARQRILRPRSERHSAPAAH